MSSIEESIWLPNPQTTGDQTIKIPKLLAFKRGTNLGKSGKTYKVNWARSNF